MVISEHPVRFRTPAIVQYANRGESQTVALCGLFAACLSEVVWSVPGVAELCGPRGGMDGAV